MSPRSRRSERKQLEGVGLSPGTAIGVVFRVIPEGPPIYRLEISEEDVERELKRFQSACRTSKAQLSAMQKKFAALGEPEPAYILDAHLLILDDPVFQEEIKRRIRADLQSPERALRECENRWLSAYRTVMDPLLRDRANDLEDVVNRLLANLIRPEEQSPLVISDSVVLVGASLNVSSLIDFPAERIAGLISTRGGPASHLTILARSLGIPLVAGVADLEPLMAGRRVMVDGGRGRVTLDPTGKPAGQRLKSKTVQVQRAANQPLKTEDGQRIHLFVNAERESEVRRGLSMGAEGVGLFRSEYLFLEDKEGPLSEARQYEEYARLARACGSQPAHVRTVDMGDEGHPYFSRLAGEEEPILGLRGIRFSLAYPEIFKSQLRAVVRACSLGQLKLVFPMVSGPDEVLRARVLLEEVYSELESETGAAPPRCEIGIMVEVPAAVFCLESLARVCNFFLVGSNDLVQYTLAVGRNNQLLAEAFNPFHPAVLRILQEIAKKAEKAGRPAILCGEVASAPIYSLLLIGMGYRHLSVSPQALDEIGNSIRKVSSARARKVVEEVLKLETQQEVQRFVEGLARDSLASPVG